jgi:hypothetical protein
VSTDQHRCETFEEVIRVTIERSLADDSYQTVILAKHFKQCLRWTRTYPTLADARSDFDAFMKHVEECVNRRNEDARDPR